ncbi:hypothetical protein DCE93_13405 [Agromyces badenianii]|uniref:Uncharacterized protein n=1 Tax=Agromyces badenianii TaxID=2080742 RepID=A0A2S0WYW2_9MICO|nr:hypothetical protein [Agromyces badenianii]AWB96516.1 hypothetical protein DCE93_13405 [Agromyces badenianii]PWC05392.1 hypothetical protein DCE94_03715 [Agromyces badenianii]
MTAVIDQPIVRTEARSRAHEIWRIVRLHCVNPSVFFGVPWIILGSAWAIMMIVGLIITGAGGPADDMAEGMRYSWAVLSPQWYLVVVGVQAIGLTFSFALGFGTTRRDFWLGTSAMFGIVSLLNAVAIATLVQIEKATNGWGIGIAMFDSLWYGQQGWLTDFYTTLAMQLLVLFIGASVTTVYMRWRMRGMMIVLFSSIVLLLAFIAIATFSGSWPAIVAWLGSIGVAGGFTIVLGLAVVCAIGGYLVIRRATPR